MGEPTPTSPGPSGEFLLYQTEDGRTRIQCRFENETIWLTQALISELFQVTVPTVNEHLKGIFAEGELEAGATIRKFRIVRLEGRREVTREIEHYRLTALSRSKRKVLGMENSFERSTVKFPKRLRHQWHMRGSQFNRELRGYRG